MAQVTDPRQSCAEMLIIVADAALQLQQESVKRRIAAGGRSISIYCECDGTPERVRLQSDSSCRLLGGEENKVVSKH
jgi:hypothetical protein